MKTHILAASCVLALAASGYPQDEMNREPVTRLGQSAAQDLQKSVQALNQLRDQMAAEQLPLAKELSELEERVARQRRQYEEVSRQVDNGSLALADLKTTVKARQDELTYVGSTLLDEFARTFDSKINVAELQYCGAAIESAKQAVENTTLSQAEKLEQQTAFAGVALQRLFDVVGGMRFAGKAVDDQGTVVDGQYALLGPVTLFRAKSGTAGLAVPQSGSSFPLIRPLEGEFQTGIGALVQDGQGVMPLDPSRGGALKALIQRTNLIHIFQKGGPIMWPLLAASVLALATVLERLLFLMNERRKRDPRSRERFFADVEVGDMNSAVRTCQGTTDFVLRALGYALEHKEKSLGNALMYAQTRELKRFRRGIPILDTVITLAPLLGLLGTVTGMMSSFSLIGGELSGPGAITGGIAEALIATAFGLGIAITALLPFNFLNARLDEATSELDSAARQLELLAHPHVTQVMPVPDYVPRTMPSTPEVPMGAGRR